MRSWMWTMQNWLNQAGWLGITGLGLLVFSAVFYLSAVKPDHARIAELQETAVSLRQHAQLTVAQGGITATPDMPTQLNLFYQFFPPAPTKNNGLAKIYSAAQHHAIVLETGEYRYVTSPNSRLARYQITLPIKGSYLQIRSFIDEILTKIPYAAIDDVSFKRENISSPMLDARIKLTLFFGQS